MYVNGHKKQKKTSLKSCRREESLPAVRGHALAEKQAASAAAKAASSDFSQWLGITQVKLPPTHETLLAPKEQEKGVRSQKAASWWWWWCYRSWPFTIHHLRPRLLHLKRATFGIYCVIGCGFTASFHKSYFWHLLGRGQRRWVPLGQVSSHGTIKEERDNFNIKIKYSMIDHKKIYKIINVKLI